VLRGHCRGNGEGRYGRGMQPISYAPHQFPPDIIRHAVWLYLRFTLSYRDVEELLADREQSNYLAARSNLS
jgi:transposase-like protein